MQPPAGQTAGSVVQTHCPYCAFQCGMTLQRTPDGTLTVGGDSSFPVNNGALCIKGWTAASLLTHPDRLLTPLVRNAAGELESASWVDALNLIARKFTETQAAYGRDAVGIFGGGSLTNEKTYLLGKFARVALRTSSIDYNGRFCMSSAAAAGIRAFGIDRGLPFPIADIAHAETILLIGANPAETMPPMMQYFEAQRTNGGRLIVADPRRTLTAQAATLHLKITPGYDLALANGLLHLLIRFGYIDERYIRERTEGFDRVRATVNAYWPERVERLTGIPENQLTQAAHMLGQARAAMVLASRAAEQQSQGVNNTLAFINIALALGLVGKQHSGYGCITGQGNGQGGREHGQKADQLPGYRRIDDPVARQHMADVWGVPEESIPGPGKSAYDMLDALGTDGGVRSLFVMGSNIVVSAPRAMHVRERLNSLDFLVVCDFFLSETAELADVVLPTAQWAEEEGTMTNLEGRVLYRQQAAPPPDGVPTDIEVLCALADRLGAGDKFTFERPGAVFEELRRASAGGVADYAGISYDKIAEQRGVFWPCPDESHEGTPRMFAESFPTPSGKARFHAVQHQASGELPDADYPLYLTTGRLLAHYQSGTQTRRVAELTERASEPFAEMHPTVAQRYGLADGQGVRLVTRRGEATFRVKTVGAMRDDTIFVPFHWGGSGSANMLTNPALDPVSRMPEFKVCAVRIEPVHSAQGKEIA